MTRTLLSVLAACLVLAGCADDPGPAAESPGDASGVPTAEPSDVEPTDSPDVPTTARARTAAGLVLVDLEGLDAYYEDLRFPHRVHLIPKAVISDPEGERWADVFVSAPTRVYEPGSRRPLPLPADPVGWVTSHPRVETLRVSTTRVGGEPARVLDLVWSGGPLFGDRDGSLASNGVERYVLWQEQGAWLLATASTFRGTKGLLAADEADDALARVLGQLELRRT